MPARSTHPLATFLGAVLLTTGCYMPQEGELTPTAEGLESASEDAAEGDGYTGSLDGGRGIMHSDGFKLFWQHYSVWDGGACTNLRLQNEDDPVRGWQMILHTSDAMTYWADDGGAFFFPDGDMIWVESEDNTVIERFESVEMYYCAEPAAELRGLEVSWREVIEDHNDPEDSRDDSSDGGDPSNDFSGTMDYADASGNSARLHYSSWTSTGLACIDVKVENTGVRSVIIERFTLDFDGDIVLGLHEGAEVRQDQPDELTFIFPPERESDPGDTVSARACMTPLAQPQRLEELVLTPIP